MINDFASPNVSIVIPTKDRQNIIIETVLSVLNQNYNKDDLIISDNSIDRNLTIEKLNSIKYFSLGRNFKYVYPPQAMGMAEHWQFASEFANGKYIIILTDRFAMRPSALKTIFSNIDKSGLKEQIIVWPVKSNYNSITQLETTPEFDGRVRHISSKDLLKKLCDCSGWADGQTYFNNLPRALNCMFSSEIAEKIRNKHGKLFFPLSPDYTFAFLAMAYTDGISYIDKPLYISHGNESNGLRAMLSESRQFDSSIIQTNNTLLDIDTIFNTLIKDFFQIKKLVGEKYQDTNIDIKGYFLSNYDEILNREKLGAQMNTRKIFKEFNDKVALLTYADRVFIEKNLKPRQNFLVIIAKRYLRKIGLFEFSQIVYSFFLMKKFMINNNQVKYKSVNEAALMTDYYLEK